MIQKVFITKYALTSGIIECEMEVRENEKSCYGTPKGFVFLTGFYNNDFHLTNSCLKTHECMGAFLP